VAVLYLGAAGARKRAGSGSQALDSAAQVRLSAGCHEAVTATT